MRRATRTTVGLLAVVVFGTVPGLEGARPAPSSDWRCAVTVGNTAGVLPFRSYAFSPQFTKGSARFRGDSNFTAGDDLAGTSSVFVSAHDDGCGWDVWADPDTPLVYTALGEKPATRVPRVMELGEGSWYAVRGYYRMRFFAAVRVIAGKSGC